MTEAQKRYANQLKRTIKTGMNVLGLDDGTYRMMLQRVSEAVSGKPKNSITQMSIDELKAVIEDMRERGFTPKRGKTASGKSKSPRTEDNSKEKPMLRKIRALWITMAQQGIVRDGSDEALQTFARNHVNKRRRAQDRPLVLNIIAMTDYELYVVIETLKSWQKRELQKRGRDA